MLKLTDDATHGSGCNIAIGAVLDAVTENEITGSTIYLSAFTLFSNYINALDGNTAYKVKHLKSPYIAAAAITNAVIDTTNFLKSLEHTGNRVVVYIPNYKRVAKKLTEKGFKLDSSFIGIPFIINTLVTGFYIKIKQKLPNYVIESGDFRLPFIKKGYIVTSEALDLAGKVLTTKISLIESHTGEIKSKNRFFTKLNKFSNHDMSFIPLCKLTLVIFGSKRIRGLNSQVKKFAYEALLAKGVTSLTYCSSLRAILNAKDKVLLRQIESIANALD